MTNSNLRKLLKSGLQGIAAEAARGVELTKIPPPPTEAERAEILDKFRVTQSRIHADLCRCISIAGEVELATGLTDENQLLADQLRKIHDEVIVKGVWGK